ncbi:hypothetical protein [Sulfitobacter sediminilitoris]|uniref:hypothetical protein n=1 Tax=Sulfitobacter sediminilitoris TaxID=2698830 RepID=UPI001954E759|nr:hypothetical protein [Sulfitobacter sediminilitoris]
MIRYQSVSSIKTKALANLGTPATNQVHQRVKFSEKVSGCQKPAQMARHIHPQARATTPAHKQPRKRAMKTNKRFIKGIVAAAAKEDTVMPWARGSRRATFIAKRNNAEKQRKTA